MIAKDHKNQDGNYVIAGSSEYLANLKKVNIFVGANNTGKSRFLRQIYKGIIDGFVFFKDEDLNFIETSNKKQFV